MSADQDLIAEAEEFVKYGSDLNPVEADRLIEELCAALSRAAAPEPEWEYGTAHADDPQAVDMGYSLEGARRRVAQWNASDPERKGIVVRAPKRAWEPLPVGAAPEPHTEHVRVTECWHMDCTEGDCDHRDEFGEPEDLSACPPAPMDVCVGCMVDRGAGADPAHWEDAPLIPWPCEKTGPLPVGGQTE